MATFVEDIGSILTAAAVATTGATSTGWTLKYRDLEPTPAQMVAVIPSGGLDGEQVVELDYPSVQVLVRGSSAAGGALNLGPQAARASITLPDGSSPSILSVSNVPDETGQPYATVVYCG